MPGDDLKAEAEDWGFPEEELRVARAAVEQALRSAAHLLSPEETELLRDDLMAYVLGSPSGRAALENILDRRAPDASGDVAKEGSAGGPPERSVSGRGRGK